MFPRRSEWLSYGSGAARFVRPFDRGRNRYGRGGPECSTSITEFPISLSYKFTKFESLSHPINYPPNYSHFPEPP